MEGCDNDEEQRRFLEQIVIDKDLPVSMRTIQVRTEIWEVCLEAGILVLQGAVRYCEKCAIIKPDRAHHCSVCGSCVLKMDHHCPWVANCIGFYNYKFFLSMLFHCACTNWLIVSTAYPILSRTVSNP